MGISMRNYLYYSRYISLLLLTACSQAHLISVAVAKPDHDAKNFPSGHYTLDKGHTSITVKVSHLGLSNYTMQFTNFDADLHFNAEFPQKSQLVATVYTNSIETNYPYTTKKDFDKELAFSSAWFNANTYPKAVFKSTSIELTGKNSGIIHGELDFLGVKQPLTLEVTFNGGYLKKPFAGVPALGFSAKSSMQRSNWGLNTYVPAIGDLVKIAIECEFHKNPDAT